MDISINANVECKDGPVGHTTSVIINPKTRALTHLVVETKTLPKEERMVPIDLVAEATADNVKLTCTHADVEKLEQFLEHEFIQVDMPLMDYAPRTYVIWPYAEPEEQYVDIVHEHIPAGELAVRRGTVVEATDGPVGKVDEFLVDAKNGNITHLVLREGHLWGKKDIVVPISQIDSLDGDSVHLQIGKAAIAELPAIPIKRWWQ
mgnify:CR=1 FL=1